MGNVNCNRKWSTVSCPGIAWGSFLMRCIDVYIGGRSAVHGVSLGCYVFMVGLVWFGVCWCW